jgi:uncharacterized protein DUF4893
MGGRTLKAVLAAAAFLVPVAAQADWHDHATAFDQRRLARLDEARDRALAEAGDAAREAFAAPSVSRGSLAGTWRCRTVKLGGMTPQMVYSWYRCRITDQGGVLAFEKLSGTQRMGGLLYPDGDGYVYLGASWVKGETPHRYSGTGASFGARATPDDQAGRLVATADGARIEMPYPVQESVFDVIELRR